MMDAPDESGTPPAEHEAAPAAADCGGRLGCMGVEETAVGEIQSEKEQQEASSSDEHDAEDDDDEELPDVEDDDLSDDDGASSERSELSVCTNAAVPAVDLDPLEVSRRIMFTRYAQVVPSVQQGIAVGLHEQTSCFTHEDDGTTSVSAASEFQFCSSGWCQELMQRKDARILELQCALDHMVQAMTIQQHDIAAQRLFLAKQADHLTKLSMSLHQEKLALQVDKARHVRSRSNSRCSTPRASIDTVRDVTPKQDSVYGFGSCPMARKSSPSADTAMESSTTVVAASEVFYSTSTVAKDEQASSQIEDEGNPSDVFERCVSLSAIGYRPPIETDFERFTRSQSTRVLRPELLDMKPGTIAASNCTATFEPTLSDINLNDNSTCETASIYSHSSSSSLLVVTHNGDRGSTAESEKMELMSDVPLGTSSKKAPSVSFGQRLRSIRWKA